MTENWINSTVAKIKKEIEVNELINYPIFRKMTDAMSGKTEAVFKVDAHTITRVVCGIDLYPSIQVFRNHEDTLSAIYWCEEITKQEFMKYYRKTLKNLNHGMEL